VQFAAHVIPQARVHGRVVDAVEHRREEAFHDGALGFVPPAALPGFTGADAVSGMVMPCASSAATNASAPTIGAPALISPAIGASPGTLAAPLAAVEIDIVSMLSSTTSARLPCAVA